MTRGILMRGKKSSQKRVSRVFLSFFLIILFYCITGCGNGKTGIILKVTTDTTGIIPLSKQAQAVIAAATGDGGANFPNRFLTPTSFTVAFNRFTVFQAETGTGATQPLTPVGYTVFDVGSTVGTSAT